MLSDLFVPATAPFYLYQIRMRINLNENTLAGPAGKSIVFSIFLTRKIGPVHEKHTVPGRGIYR